MLRRKTYVKQAIERFRQAGAALKTAEQGAATSVLPATSPQLERIGWRYFRLATGLP